MLIERKQYIPKQWRSLDKLRGLLIKEGNRERSTVFFMKILGRVKRTGYVNKFRKKTYFVIRGQKKYFKLRKKLYRKVKIKVYKPLKRLQYNKKRFLVKRYKRKYFISFLSDNTIRNHRWIMIQSLRHVSKHCLQLVKYNRKHRLITKQQIIHQKWKRKRLLRKKKRFLNKLSSLLKKQKTILIKYHTIKKKRLKKKLKYKPLKKIKLRKKKLKYKPLKKIKRNFKLWRKWRKTNKRSIIFFSKIFSKNILKLGLFSKKDVIPNRLSLELGESNINKFLKKLKKQYTRNRRSVKKIHKKLLKFHRMYKKIFALAQKQHIIRAHILLTNTLRKLKPGFNLQRTLVAGRLYTLPVPISENHDNFKAAKWLIDAATNKLSNENIDVLIAEMLIKTVLQKGKAYGFLKEFIKLAMEQRHYKRFLRRRRKRRYSKIKWIFKRILDKRSRSRKLTSRIRRRNRRERNNRDYRLRNLHKYTFQKVNGKWRRKKFKFRRKRPYYHRPHMLMPIDSKQFKRKPNFNNKYHKYGNQKRKLNSKKDETAN